MTPPLAGTAVAALVAKQGLKARIEIGAVFLANVRVGDFLQQRADPAAEGGPAVGIIKRFEFGLAVPQELRQRAGLRCRSGLPD